MAEPESIGKSRAPHLRVAALAALASLCLVVPGCTLFVGSRPGTIVDPEAAGLVTQATLVPGSQTSYRVVVGSQQITLDTRGAAKLYDGFPEGGVVVYGTHPRPWYLGTYADNHGCFLITGARAFDDPDAVILVYGQLGGVGGPVSWA